ncbi:hypothetical protein AB28_5304 [Raoultella ornithinolytica 2-156-04_S1_C2]|nr:hypothetical protein AB00_5312 [Raoultella ornithinolytica 2-156-04_S1_C1]KDX08824.1 hypothetical protein AB28_5304 [Raoultella ornithinolytica 2-156-04_S1_C2]
MEKSRHRAKNKPHQRIIEKGEHNALSSVIDWLSQFDNATF